MPSNLEAPTRHHSRKASSSGFAESFDLARSKLSELDIENLDMDPKSVKHTKSSENPIEESPPSPASMVSDRSTASSLDSLSDATTPDINTNVADNFAFAFDIDGVLVRGGKVIPEAVEAMKVLNGENEYGVRV